MGPVVSNVAGGIVGRGTNHFGQELAVMVNFVCQLDKPCADQIKYYVWCFQMRLAFESVNSVK